MEVWDYGTGEMEEDGTSEMEDYVTGLWDEWDGGTGRRLFLWDGWDYETGL